MEITIEGKKYQARVTHYRIQDTRNCRPYISGCDIKNIRSSRDVEHCAFIVGEEERELAFPRGGITVAKVFFEHNGEELYACGMAHCSIKDNFNRFLGKKIALGRAIKNLRAYLNIPKEEVDD